MSEAYWINQNVDYNISAILLISDVCFIDLAKIAEKIKDKTNLRQFKHELLY